MTINPYLTFDGNTEEAFNFYKSVFGGDVMLHRFGGAPGMENIPEADKQKVMHAALPIGNNMLMASDAIASMGKPLAKGNNVSLSIQADSKEEADRVFQGLSNGGTVTMPLADAFWGAYFGMCDDKFGVHWMVNYEYPRA